MSEGRFEVPEEMIDVLIGELKLKLAGDTKVALG